MFSGKNSTSGGLAFDYTLSGGKTLHALTKKSVVQININIDGSQPGSIKIENKHKGMLFARLILEGIPLPGDQTASESNLKMSLVYKDMKGNDIEIDKLAQGTDFMAIVTVSNNATLGNYKDMALTEIFPSGWEITNTRLSGIESVHESDAADYIDFRDDRVYTYFNIPQYSVRKYIVLLNAAYLGKFYLPTVTCEAMYDNHINARIPGKWVEVVSGD
jgi:uncharacterized protein YfaS (alpha-2-macroglobulin family)